MFQMIDGRIKVFPRTILGASDVELQQYLLHDFGDGNGDGKLKVAI